MYRIEQIKSVLHRLGGVFILEIAAFFAVVQEDQRQSKQGIRLDQLPIAEAGQEIGFSQDHI